MSISPNSIQLVEQIYENCEVSIQIFKASVPGRPTPCVVKIQGFDDLETRNRCITEARAMYDLDHPNLVKLIGYFEEIQYQQIWLLMDFFEKGDLYKEMIRRKRARCQWSESELLDHFKSLISACAYLQSNSFAHRDIKPHNIFVCNDGSLKIADFGAIFHNESFIEGQVSLKRTINGTPVYLSPKLREGYMRFLNDNTQKYTDHNPVKSDVYSLGITFLCMCILREPTELGTVSGLEERIEKVLNEVPNPRIKEIISAMIRVNEDYRPTFEQLYSHFFETIVTNEDLILAIKAKETQKAEEMIVSMIRKGKQVNLSISASNSQLVEFTKKTSLYDSSAKNEQRILSCLPSFVRMNASVEQPCLVCGQMCNEIQLRCCDLYVHEQCSLRALNQEKICLEIACGKCSKELKFCYVCKCYNEKSKLILLNCNQHYMCPVCAKANNYTCLDCANPNRSTNYRYNV